MGIEEEFFETFNIKPEEHEVPGRDWDDDGLASWYLEKVYPNLSDGAIVDLVCIREALNKQPISNIWSREVPSKDEFVGDLLWDLIWYQKHLNKSQLQEKVQAIIEKHNQGDD